QQMDENQRGQGASHPPEDRAGPGRPVEHQSAEHQGQRDRGPGRFQEQQSRPYRRWSLGVGEDPVVQRGERGDPGGRGQPQRAGPLADDQKRQIEQVEVGSLANLNQRPIVRHEDAQVIQEEPRWLQGLTAIVEQSPGSGKRQARTNWWPGSLRTSRFSSRTLSVARTWEAVRLVRVISSSTPTGWLSNWPSKDRSWSLRQSSAGWRTGVSSGAVCTSRTSGPSSSRMSSTVSTRRAPSRIRRWQPRLARLSTGPGTAKTSRFCSMAWCAVDSDPLRGAATTTTTPRQRPEMIRLRCESQSTWLSVAVSDLASSGRRDRGLSDGKWSD